MTLYLHKDDSPFKVYIESQVRQDFYNRYPGSFLPTVLPDDLLEAAGYFPVEVEEDNSKNTELYTAILDLEKLQVKEDSTKASGYRAFIEIKYEIDPDKEAQKWEELRQLRNKRLQDSDWILISETVEEETKLKYLAYRQLLRDCLNVTDDVTKVNIPEPPELRGKGYSESVELVSEETLEKIRKYNPRRSADRAKHSNFLKLWEAYSFSNRFSVINSLVLLSDSQLPFELI